MSLRRLLHPAYRRLETQVHPLRYLFVEITQRCNLRCLHCGSDCTREAQLAELTTEEWLAFFDRLAARVDRRRLALVVTGGEPFCHPRWDEIVAGLQRNQLRFGVVSNGYALSARNVERLVAGGAVSLTVSLDGLRASHDWLRNVPGAYDRAVAGIRTAAAAGLPFFDVVTCVNPKNLDELPEVMQTLRGLGVPAWRLFTIFPKGRAKDNPELLLSPAQLRRLLEWIRDQRRALGDEAGFTMSFSCEGFLPAALDAEVRDEPYFCRAGISIGSVLCDGSISACPNLARSFVQGNVRDDDLLDVWEHRFERFRDRAWMRRGRCADCGEWSRCLGNSLHLWDEERGETMLCYARAYAEGRPTE